MSRSSAEANSSDIADLVNFPWWQGHVDSPPWPYSLLLTVSIYRRINNLMHEPNDALYSIEANQDESLGLLWELYWKRFYLLEEMLFKLTMPIVCTPNITSVDQLRDQRPSEQYPHLLPIINLLFPQEVENRSRAFKLAYDEPCLTQIAQDLGPTDRNTETLSSRLTGWKQLNQGLGERFNRTVTEARQTMKAFLEAKLEDSEDVTKGYSLRDYSGETNLTDEMERKAANCSSVLLFAVSGSGKTRRIKHLLSQNFGFYFQACNLPADIALCGLHGPRKIDGAGDTSLLAKIMKHSERFIDMYPDMSAHIFPHLIIRWITNLIHCRIILLHHFINVASWNTKSPYPKGFAHLLPQLWLDFQTASFTGELDLPDPFEALFQISCLLPTMNEWLETAESYLPDSLLYCLDEAQSELDCSIPTRGGFSEMKLSLFHIWVRCFSEMRLKHSGPQFVFAGTSLQVEKAFEAVINPNCHPKSLQAKFAGKGLDGDAFLFSDFPLVKTKDQFYQMMKKQGFVDVLAMRRVHHLRIVSWFTGMIFDHGKALLGRPKWSMMYLERINKQLKKMPNQRFYRQKDFKASLTTLVEKTARTVRNEILADLIKRLKNLAKRESAEFISKVCSVVINSDLLDRPIAFEDDVGARMISEAFAVMKPVEVGSSKYFIEEHLAVHAAKLFFLLKKPSEVEKALINLQARLTNDASSFDKHAEWFLAWKLNQLFVAAEDRLTGSTRSLQLKEFRTLLAISLSGDSPLSLSEMTLIRGEKIGHMYNGTIELPEWMKSVRELASTTGTNRPINATFYFPDNNAGPDLVFALQKSGVPILCLLQLKCGDAELDKAIKSLDLTQAYLSSRESRQQSVRDFYQAKHQAVMEEVAKWSATDIVHRRRWDEGDQSRLSDYWVPRVLRQVRQEGDETSLW